MLADVADGALDHCRPDFKTAIDRAPQGLGLHDRQTEVVADFERVGLVVPTPILALEFVDDLQGAVQCRPHPRVAGHAVGLPEHEGRQAVVIHVVMLAGNVQESGSLGIAKDVVQGILLDGAVAAMARGVPIGEEGQQSHAHQAEVIARPVALRTLVPLQPLQTAVQRLAALRGDLPGTIAPRDAWTAQSSSAREIDAHQG